MGSGSAAVAIALVTVGLGWVVIAGALLVGAAIGFAVAKASQRGVASGFAHPSEAPPLR